MDARRENVESDSQAQVLIFCIRPNIISIFLDLGNSKIFITKGDKSGIVMNHQQVLST